MCMTPPLPYTNLFLCRSKVLVIKLIIAYIMLQITNILRYKLNEVQVENFANYKMQA